MKLFKKIAAIMLSVMMVLGMASVVSAEGTTTSGTSATTKGKITINNAIVGQTYKIYQILELESFSDKPLTGTNTGNYAYKVAAKWENFIATGAAGSDYLEIEGDYVNWKGAADDTRVAEFAKKALAYATANELTATKSTSATTETVEFTGLNLGYYLVDSSAGALCSLNTTDTEATIQEKNGVPSVEKKVQEDSTNNWGDNNTADIGQTVNFQTTITAQAGAHNYVLHDKMDKGLTFTDSSVDVKLKNGETETVLAKGTDYTLITSGFSDECTFEITFTQDFCNTLAAGNQIIVTYSATLNENAVIARNGNVNETWLKYGESSETTHDKTTTKTFELPVFKYTMKNSTETALAGATFTLSKNSEGTDPIKLVKTSTEGTYRVAKTGEAGTVTEVTTPDSGKFTIKGLDADTYYLTEIQQPAGYNKLSAPIKVVIADDGTIKVDDAENSTAEVKVENKTGSILPSTGGSGTTLIYILGAVLVLGSGVALITRKRMR